MFRPRDGAGREKLLRMVASIRLPTCARGHSRYATGGAVPEQTGTASDRGPTAAVRAHDSAIY